MIKNKERGMEKDSTKKATDKNIHKEHRERMKSRFLQDGLDVLDAHQVLELLLFYSIPRRDTNVIAHRLIDKFGSLPSVFDAPYEELLSIEGISDHSATLIKLVPALINRYSADKNKSRIRISSLDDAGRYLVNRYEGIEVETVYLMLLDNKNDLIDCVKIHEGSINSSAITTRVLVEAALYKHASSVILAHNHPRGIALPSSDDLHTTRTVRSAFDAVGVNMLAHLIVAGNSFCDILEHKKEE